MLLRYNVCAMVYCRHKGHEDIEESLVSTCILVLNVVKDFISKRKAKNQVIMEKYQELHRLLSLELKIFLLLRHYELILTSLKRVRSVATYHLKLEQL